MNEENTLPFKCKKCGADHGMVIDNRITGERTPLDLCSDCIFSGCRYDILTEQVEIGEQKANTKAYTKKKNTKEEK